MEAAEIALLISFGSLLVAATSLGWNIYRDIIRKPKLRVSISVGHVVHPSFPENLPRVVVSITNHGPGKSKANMLILRKSSWWRILLRKQVYAVLIHDFEDPLSGRLPAELEPGDKVDLTFRHSPNIFLGKDDYNRIGVKDPFDNIYWCSKTNYKKALKNYKNRDITNRPSST